MKSAALILGGVILIAFGATHGDGYGVLGFVLIVSGIVVKG